MSNKTAKKSEASALRFNPYPMYKDSGIGWVDKIPVSWRATPLKHVAHYITGWTPPSGRDEYFSGEHPWANISDLGPRVVNDTENTVSDLAIKEERLKIAPKDSLLFSFKLSIGLVSFAGQDMYTNEAIAAFTPDNEISLLYLYWAAPIFITKNANENIYGAKLLNQELITNAKLFVPTDAEQRAIAAFLDQETARIDQLIAKKERQIDLLQEKRSALITHAVTKGLNPKAKMKDSGIEWLGEIPEQWEIKRLGKIAISIQTGPFGSQLHASDYVDDGIPVINPANLQDGVIIPDPKCAISGETFAPLNRHELKEGDIVFARRGEMGRCALVTKESEGFLCGTGSLRLRINAKYASPLFLSMFLGIAGVRDHLLLESVGSTMDNLNTGILARIPIAVPNIDEQLAITQHIVTEQQRIRNTAAAIGRSVAKLREYRTALISAAVTGKIDVREVTA